MIANESMASSEAPFAAFSSYSNALNIGNIIQARKNFSLNYLIHKIRTNQATREINTEHFNFLEQELTEEERGSELSEKLRKIWDFSGNDFKSKWTIPEIGLHGYPAFKIKNEEDFYKHVWLANFHQEVKLNANQGKTYKALISVLDNKSHDEDLIKFDDLGYKISSDFYLKMFAKGFCNILALTAKFDVRFNHKVVSYTRCLEFTAHLLGYATLKGARSEIEHAGFIVFGSQAHSNLKSALAILMGVSIKSVAHEYKETFELLEAVLVYMERPLGAFLCSKIHVNDWPESLVNIGNAFICSFEYEDLENLIAFLVFLNAVRFDQNGKVLLTNIQLFKAKGFLHKKINTIILEKLDNLVVVKDDALHVSERISELLDLNYGKLDKEKIFKSSSIDEFDFFRPWFCLLGHSTDPHKLSAVDFEQYEIAKKHLEHLKGQINKEYFQFSVEDRSLVVSNFHCSQLMDFLEINSEVFPLNHVFKQYNFNTVLSAMQGSHLKKGVYKGLFSYSSAYINNAGFIKVEYEVNPSKAIELVTQEEMRLSQERILGNLRPNVSLIKRNRRISGMSRSDLSVLSSLNALRLVPSNTHGYYQVEKYYLDVIAEMIHTGKGISNKKAFIEAIPDFWNNLDDFRLRNIMINEPAYNW